VALTGKWASPNSDSSATASKD
jgi:hypothetical protein